MKEYDACIANHLEQIKGKQFQCAVGSSEGTTTIQVDKDILQRSSLNKRSSLTVTDSTIEERNISVCTLDSILKKEKFKTPFILKIDTEGFELEVIKGAKELLKDTLYVISEVSVASRFEGSYSFYDYAAGVV